MTSPPTTDEATELDHLVFLVPLGFYSHTCSRGIGFADTVILIDNIMTFNLTAFVNYHAFTVVAGKLFSFLPLGELAFRINLTSVFFGSIAVWIFYRLVHYETGSRLVAALCALTCMVTQSLWWHSTIIENYAASAAFTVLCLYLWRRFGREGRPVFLYALCATAGLAVSNHIQMGFFCVGVAVTGIISAVVSRENRLRLLAGCFLGANLGLSFWVGLLVKDASAYQSVTAAVANATTGPFRHVFFSGDLGPSLADSLFLFLLQSPGPYFLVCLLGIVIWSIRENTRSDFVGIWIAFSLNTIFFSFYNTWDKYAFLLPSFMVFLFAGAIGLHWTLERLAFSKPLMMAAVIVLLAGLFVGPYFYSNIPSWAEEEDSLWALRYSNAPNAHLYQQSRYTLDPNKRDYRDIQVFSKLLFDKLPTGAVVIDDDSRTYYSLAGYYQRYLGIRPDLSFHMVNSWGFANWGHTQESLAGLLEGAYYSNHPVFLVSLEYPISFYISLARERFPFAVEKFELSRSLFIYRMELATAARPGVAPHPSLSPPDIGGIPIKTPALKTGEPSIGRSTTRSPTAIDKEPSMKGQEHASI